MGTFFPPTRNVNQEHYNGPFDDDGPDEVDDFWAKADRAHERDR